MLKRTALLALSLGAFLAFARAQQVAPTEALSPADEQLSFRVPPGFEVQLVASEPDIYKPMNLAFDSQGRLWVTSSREYPFPSASDKSPVDRVTILDDFGPVGRARKITQFADNLNIPIGVLPTSPDSALVYSINQIQRLTDSDGDGRADRREPLFKGFGYEDTHGMANSFTWGADGWIYACHGFHNTSNVEGGDQGKVTMQSGNSFRFRPDGSRLEQRTWGQVNPFGLAFDALGNLYSCDCHSRPLYMLIPGAYYPSFGKPHDGLGYAPEMIDHDHGSTGIAGIASYDADHFPEPYRGGVFVGNVVTNRVHFDKLAWTGATPKAVTQPDLLTSTDPWFRPVDIELGPDGALYVADFYNRIIGHYEVPLTHPGRDRDRGRIWRIVYRGDRPHRSESAPAGDWSTADAPKLITDLDHPNLAVRTLASNELVRRHANDSAPALIAGIESGRFSPTQQAAALWVLDRSHALDDALLARALTSSVRELRLAAIRIVGELGRISADQRSALLTALADPEALTRRAALESLARHPDPADAPRLLDFARQVPADDPVLSLAARITLRNSLQTIDSWADLVRDRGEADRRLLGEVALGVPSRVAATFLLDEIEANRIDPARLLDAQRHIARRGDESTDRRLVSWLRSIADLPPRESASRIRAIDQGIRERGARLNDDAMGWSTEIADRLLASGDTQDRAAGIELTQALALATVRPRLEALVADPAAPEPIRAQSLAALTSLDPVNTVPLLARFVAGLNEPLPLRERAADLLAGLALEPARAALLATLKEAPSTIQRRIAVGLCGTHEGAEALLKAAEQGTAPRRLLQDPAVQILLTRAEVTDLGSRLDTLLANLPPADDSVAALIGKRLQGFSAANKDAARGALVYQKNCQACHKLDNQGGLVGPQLDGIGNRGVERLMEDVLDPNRNLDQAFRSTILALEDGRVVSGLLVRDEGEVLEVADAQGKPQRFDRNQVAERSVVPISPMPGNWGTTLTEQEVHDLMAFLLSKSEAPRP